MADRRVLAFGLVALALLLAAFGISDHGDPAQPANAPRQPAPPESRALPRQTPGLRRATRRFIRAFLRYEVGVQGEPVRKAIRANATADFAAELLDDPPHLAPSAPATIRHLTSTPLSSDPPRALISGSARRDGSEEPFSFLFEAQAGRWRAAGPAE